MHVFGTVVQLVTAVAYGYKFLYHRSWS